MDLNEKRKLPNIWGITQAFSVGKLAEKDQWDPVQMQRHTLLYRPIEDANSRMQVELGHLRVFSKDVLGFMLRLETVNVLAHHVTQDVLVIGYTDTDWNCCPFS